MPGSDKPAPRGNRSVAEFRLLQIVGRQHAQRSYAGHQRGVVNHEPGGMIRRGLAHLLHWRYTQKDKQARCLVGIEREVFRAGDHWRYHHAILCCSAQGRHHALGQFGVVGSGQVAVDDSYLGAGSCRFRDSLGSALSWPSRPDLYFW